MRPGARLSALHAAGRAWSLVLEGMQRRRRPARDSQRRTATETRDGRRQAAGLSSQSKRYETCPQPTRNKGLAGAKTASPALPPYRPGKDALSMKEEQSQVCTYNGPVGTSLWLQVRRRHYRNPLTGKALQPRKQ